MKKYVFRLKESPQNSSHHSSFFIWCGKAVQVKREWKGGGSKPSSDCFSIPNMSLVKTHLFSVMIFWRERGTGKPFFTTECFAREVLSAQLSHWHVPLSPGALLLSAALLGGSWGFPQPNSFTRWFSEVFTWTHWSPGCVGWFFTSQALHWGAKCQHKWLSKWLMKLRHCPLRCSCLTLSPGTPGAR